MFDVFYWDNTCISSICRVFVIHAIVFTHFDLERLPRQTTNYSYKRRHDVEGRINQVACVIWWSIAGILVRLKFICIAFNMAYTYYRTN